MTAPLPSTNMPSTNGPTRLPLRDGGAVFYDVRPAASPDAPLPPLLLLPSLGGGGALWGEFRDVLGRELTTIAFEPRGFGPSSPAPPLVSTRRLAEDALAVLDALGLEQVFVFGISLGAMMATWLAADAPDRVAKLALASTAVRGLAVSPRGLVRGARLARCLLASDEPKACLAGEIVAPDSKTKAHAQEKAARTRPWSRGALLGFVGAALRHAPGPALARIRAPVLVLAGERDPIVPASSQEELAKTLPHGRFAIVPRAGHDVVLEAPRVTAGHVLSFVAPRHEGTRPR